MSMNILIVGAGVGGPALALLLQRSNPKHNITVIERFPSLRTGGQQIDLKDNGIPIFTQTGLLEPLRKLCVQESGMTLVDSNGKTLLQLGITAAGDPSGPTLTQEFEFMRGDMVKLIYDATLQDRARLLGAGQKQGSLTYEFNKTVTTLDQSASDRVNVSFSDNTTKSYDLVVAADGQGSRTRRLAFSDEINTSAFTPLNVHGAYFNIPRLPTEDNQARVYFGTNGRLVMTRTGNLPFTQVYFFLMQDRERGAEMRKVYKQPIDVQKEAWARHYCDAGWECERFVEGMRDVKDFYAIEMGQIKMPEGRLYQGRVVLLGDALYCPTAFTGQGTTLALTGAYVLAGELAKHEGDVAAALDAYTGTMRRPIQDSFDKLTFSTERGLYPSSAWGITVANHLIWAASCFRLDKTLGWLSMFAPEGKKWDLPEYQGVKFDSV